MNEQDIWIGRGVRFFDRFYGRATPYVGEVVDIKRDIANNKICVTVRVGKPEGCHAFWILPAAKLSPA